MEEWPGKRTDFARERSTKIPRQQKYTPERNKFMQTVLKMEFKGMREKKN